MLDVTRPEGVLPGARPASGRPGPGALLAGAIGMLSALGGVVLVTATGTWHLPPAAQLPVDATVGLAFPLMGLVVLTSTSLPRGARALARVLVGAGACGGVAALATAVSLAATSASGPASYAVQLQGAVWVPGFVPLLTLVPLLYPDGLLPGRGWAWAAGAAAVGIALLTVGIGLFPETFVGQVAIPKAVSHRSTAEVLTVASAVLLLPAALAALAAPVVRLRRSSGLRRRQVVVLLVSASFAAAVTGAQGLLPTPADVVLQAIAVGLVGVAIGVAVTRHGLYDLDTAIARALLATSLAVCLTGAYLTVFWVLEALPGHSSSLSAGVAAALAGAVLQPLGRRLATGVDRMYYGDRADPFAVTSDLAARLTSQGLDIERVPQVVCDTVVERLRLRGTRVRLSVGDRSPVVAGAGVVDGECGATFTLVHRGDVVGELDVWPRTGERILHERDHAVLRGIADLVSPAVAALHLHRQLQRSREALVVAREEERLGLRRDLHDGLGATLAGLRLQVETARDLSCDQRVVGLLDSAAVAVADAVAEVRVITDGLRPAGIDDLGLARALAALADRLRVPGIDVAVDVDPDLHADPAVEVALHRIAGEALANASRHSGGTRVELRVHDGDPLVLEVLDDGTGVRPRTAPGHGLGLTSMRQRAEEVGGLLDVISSAAGTTVRAVLPRSVGGS